MICKISQIASLQGCKAIVNDENAGFSYLLTDSRNLFYPAQSLFFAIKTETGDGHDYIRQLHESGVRNFVLQQLPEEISDNCNYLVFKDSIAALQQISAIHRQQSGIKHVVGITGSNGKTVVKEWLYQLLSDKYEICRSPKSYNSQIGVPLSLWQIDKNSEIGIFEAGISQPGEMQRLEEIMCPDMGIFTNLLAAHDEGFSSREEKLHEKLQLFKHSKRLICRKKHGIEKAAQQINPSLEIITWEFDDPEADIRLHREYKNGGAEISYRYGETTGTAMLRLTDEASVEDAMHCLACCLSMGVKPDLGRLEHIKMRLELIEGENGCTIIDDSYNSDINSADMAIDFMNAHAEKGIRKRTAIISDIRSGNKNEEQLYRELSALLKNKGVDRLIGIGEAIARHGNLFDCEKSFFSSARQMLESRPVFENETVLIKGARAFNLEDIVSALAKKQHETVMEINLGALVHNFKRLRSRLKPSTKSMAMIKANAYGCGDLEVAKTLAHHHCDFFGVAVTDEGVELRKAGINSGIIVMNPEPSCFERLVAYKLEPEIYSFKLLAQFAGEADRQGMRDYPVHIKIDTGMHRLGFAPDEMKTLAAELKKLPSVKVASAFSHLAAADDPDEDAFTLHQLDTFGKATEQLQQELGHKFIRHILNTAGTWRFSDYQMDMVRMGIGLYGIGWNESSDIRTVATLKTIILQIKNIKKDDTVGYNRRGVLSRDSRIAAIPIGYADGLNRAFGNRRGHVIVKGHPAPFVGNICMDVCMIDITDIDGVKEGDEVIVFGDNPTISQLAETTGTIPYEILTSVSPRVKRVYVSE